MGGLNPLKLFSASQKLTLSSTFRVPADEILLKAEKLPDIGKIDRKYFSQERIQHVYDDIFVVEHNYKASISNIDYLLSLIKCPYDKDLDV